MPDHPLKPVLLALFVCTLITPLARADAWFEQREKLRTQRAEFIEQLQASRVERAEAANARIMEFLDLIDEKNWKIDERALWGMCAGVFRLDRNHVRDIPRRIDEITEDQAVSGREKPDRAFEAALKQARKDLTEPSYDLLRRAESVGEVQAAVELMREVLCFDPDHKAIRRALGQVKLSDKVMEKINRIDETTTTDNTLEKLLRFDADLYWVSKFEAERMKAGLIWNPDRGWMPAKHADRYDKGFVFSLRRKEWMSLADANSYHSRAGRDWEIRTEHLDVRGSTDLESISQVATQLEMMYDEIFYVYALFFAEGGKYDPLQLALGLVEHPPMKVWVYRDHAEYVNRADAVSWSGGIFRPSNGTCYFYGGPSETMFHEFTHQVLHVMTEKNDAPVWLTEAIAQYTETAVFHEDRMLFRGAAYYGHLPLDELFGLKDGNQWYRHVESDRPSAYAEAGSVATFCMQAQDGRFRADFIDYVRDAYRGKDRNRTVWDYLGLSYEEFRVAYHRWGKDRS
ncbi:hypothetical protein [Algisphaera agarilytica]|uniref:DUF1570 domain-containing protein n=1 Tax=Algisphaera agarilytica TaxID=1385975 RepID=A0A7X0H3S4_9BACT|nr:hypothetical protein [Algisphaera agarilytica]MBB6428705.1 hypothetical protein [Algisphaera agarilytica]